MVGMTQEQVLEPGSGQQGPLWRHMWLQGGQGPLRRRAGAAAAWHSPGGHPQAAVLVRGPRLILEVTARVHTAPLPAGIQLGDAPALYRWTAGPCLGYGSSPKLALVPGLRG